MLPGIPSLPLDNQVPRWEVTHASPWLLGTWDIMVAEGWLGPDAGTHALLSRLGFADVTLEVTQPSGVRTGG